MTPSEIIKADFESKGLDPEPAYQKIAALKEKGDLILLNTNNSVLTLTKIPEGGVEVHLFTQDSPVTLMKSMKFFLEKIRAAGIKEVYGNADNPEIIEFIKRLDVEVVTEGLPAKYNWKAVL